MSPPLKANFWVKDKHYSLSIDPFYGADGM